MTLPDRANLDHLKKQAKDLLRLYQSGDAGAFARFRDALPAAAGRSDRDIAALGLRLHDAQSCMARERGFGSWADLSRYVEEQAAARDDRASLVRRWLAQVYAGDVIGTFHRAAPLLAARRLAEQPDFTAGDPYLACAVGDEDALREAVQSDPSWVNRPGGVLNLPPLFAVTHSSLLQLPEYGERLRRCAAFLISAGADPNQRIGNRSPPASFEHPDHDHPLSALYGAAGKANDAELTRLLLEAGADPNDGESLYHAAEDSAVCVQLLLAHRARVSGSNAVYRVLDFDNLPALALLLEHGDPNEPIPGEYRAPLLWAIRRRRSPAHVAKLLQAGADPKVTTKSGVSAYRLALQFGLPEVAALLRERGAGEPVGDDEAFVAACARADETEARRILAARPDFPRSLPDALLQRLPELAAEGADDAVRLMVTLGWPIKVRGGDWVASALNHAVFRGNAALTRFLLEHGASCSEKHGFGDNVAGTLSWASLNKPVKGGNWAGCARAMMERGLSHGVVPPDPADPDLVYADRRRMRFSPEVAKVFRREFISEAAARAAGIRFGGAGADSKG